MRLKRRIKMSFYIYTYIIIIIIIIFFFYRKKRDVGREESPNSFLFRMLD